MRRFCACVLAIGMLIGCGHPERNGQIAFSCNSLIATERVRIGKTMPASHAITKSPAASCLVEYDNPVCNRLRPSARGAGEHPKLQRFVGELFAECGKIAGSGWGLCTNRIETAEDGVKRVCGNFFLMYEEFLVGRDPEKDRISCSWEVCLDGRKVWDDSRFVSYRIRCETYFGGAHPDVQFVNGVFDRRTGRRLNAEDLFKEDSMLAVLNLLRASIARGNPESPILAQLSAPETRPYPMLRKIRLEHESSTSDWTNNPFLTKNFFLNEDGVTWTFDEYELSSYGDGCPEGTLAWKEVENHLKDRSVIPVPLAPRSEFWEKLRSADRKEIGNLIYF